MTRTRATTYGPPPVPGAGDLARPLPPAAVGLPALDGSHRLPASPVTGVRGARAAGSAPARGGGSARPPESAATGPDGPVRPRPPAVTGGNRQATLRRCAASLTAVARPRGGAAGEDVR
ncbi:MULTISPECIES: DUF6380 family protein [unclassified Streptomyces]|uniref:DUF6380 family protein n=1 Tax=unclassified Streptomyces TaxID=2593676 RepID=UPI0004C10FA6|nr:MULTISPECIES: DUF6380 family protein [unclassified Streptomyces]